MRNQFLIAILAFGFTLLPCSAYCERIRSKVSGEASVYSDKFHGKKTASGERFNQNEQTAASKTLPLGSTAKVTNKKTGESTEVRITDRGPYVQGRTIDLSKSAAKSIGMNGHDTAPVVVEKEKD